MTVRTFGPKQTRFDPAIAQTYKGTADANENASERWLFDEASDLSNASNIAEIVPADIWLFHSPVRALSQRPNDFSSEVRGLTSEPTRVLEVHQQPSGKNHEARGLSAGGRHFFVTYPQEVIAIDVSTGECATTQTATTVGRDFAPGFCISGSKGVVLADSWAESGAVVAKFLPGEGDARWAKRLGNDCREVFWAHQLKNGDAVALCKELRSPKGLHLVRLSGDSGDVILNQHLASFNAIDNGYGEATVCDFDESNETIVVSGVWYKNPSRWFREINLKTGDMTELGLDDIQDNLPHQLRWQQFATQSGTVLSMQLGNLPDKTIDVFHVKEKRHERLPLGDLKENPDDLVTDMHHRYAAVFNSGRLTFFKIGPEGFHEIKVVETSFSSVSSAMTADGIFYVSSRSDMNDNINHRLRAFNASTGEELWSVDKRFEDKPQIAVNRDGSIGWASGRKMFILS